MLGCGSLHDAENIALLTELNCALHAHVLLRRDVDYIVRDGRIEIVDEFTGRVVAGSPLARRPAGGARGQGGPRAAAATGGFWARSRCSASCAAIRGCAA